MTCSATVRLSVKNAIAPAQIKKPPVASKKDLQAQTPAQCSMGICGASAALYAFILQAAHLGRLAARQQSAFFLIGIVPNVSLQPKCRPSLLEGQSTIAATALCCDVYSPEMHPPEMQRCLKTKPLQATDTLTISISASTPVNLVPNVLAMLIEGRSTAQHQQHTAYTLLQGMMPAHQPEMQRKRRPQERNLCNPQNTVTSAEVSMRACCDSIAAVLLSVEGATCTLT